VRQIGWGGFFLLLISGCTAVQTMPPLTRQSAAPTVHVTYADPSHFSDALGLGQHENNVQRREWIGLLRQHIAQRAAPKLAVGERLFVQILDVRRAGHWGDSVPTNGPPVQSVRIVSDAEPPMMVLQWRRMDAHGDIIHMGQRTLDTDDFLARASAYAGDSLRYERVLLDRWVEQELGSD